MLLLYLVFPEPPSGAVSSCFRYMALEPYIEEAIHEKESNSICAVSYFRNTAYDVWHK